MSDHAAIFEDHREHLRRVAYQMVGSVSEAKDLVQDAYLRWKDVRLEEVEDPQSYLTTVVSRLCLDHMKSARVKREEYTGPWLPEPIAGDSFARPDRSAERADTLSMGFMVLLESLNPVERAVFLLREVFGYDYEDIADIVDKSVVNCRKIASRARKRIGDRPSRFDAPPGKQEELLGRFLEAVDGEDLDGLIDMLTEDAVVYSDGGGNVAHALDPVTGPVRTSRFLVGIKQNAPEQLEIRPTTVNGRPGFIAYENGRIQSVTSVQIADDRIQKVFIIVNPDKLTHLEDA